MRSKFEDRASDMGLDGSRCYKDMYSYSDRYGEVVYRSLQPVLIGGADPSPHPTDSMKTPLIGIFTKGSDDEDYQYAGYVSEFYKFIGNDALNQRVRDSIASVGMPILEENTILWNTNCRMRNEIIIQSSQSTRQAGDILPVMIVNNSYNGTRAATLAFGIAIDNIGRQVGRTIFGFTLGEMRQVHIDSSNTQLTSAVGSYMQVFTQDISDMISRSFNNQLSEDEMLGVLDVVEGIGKNRKKRVSEILSELNPPTQEGQDPPLPSAWQVFLAIARYSSLEPNLNVKRLLENAAESVLVIPPRMYSVLEQLQTS
jgi:hypothetical protein